MPGSATGRLPISSFGPAAATIGASFWRSRPRNRRKLSGLAWTSATPGKRPSEFRKTKTPTRAATRNPRPRARTARNRRGNRPMSKGILASAGSSQPIRITGAGPATIRAAEGEGKDAKLASFEGTAYTGAVMRPGGWFEDLIIDLGGVEVPSQHRPALRQHDHEQIVGHTTEVKVNKEGVHVAGLFSGQQEHSDKVVVPAKNGFQWQLSIGADPITTERLEPGEEADVNGRTVKGPLVISRKTRLGEISFVPLGADGDTSATIAAQQGGPKMNPWHLALKDLMTKLRAAAGTVELAKYSDGEIDKMTADEARAALKKCMDEEGKAKAADDDDDDDDDDGEDGKKAKNKSKSARALRIQAEVDQVMTAARQQA